MASRTQVPADGPRLAEAGEREYAANAGAFREEAQKGWDDIEASRYTDLTPQDLPGHVAELSTRAAQLAAEAG